MFYKLPPVGNPIRLTDARRIGFTLESFFEPYEARYYASGTAALAAAIIAAKTAKNVDRPEVVLPAYGCPDLVSAAVHAGVVPVLVDLERDRPWMQLEQLKSKINANTIAIVAVSLFGIHERLDQLRAITGNSGIVLIEDSAQAFPRNKQRDFWSGDLVVVSFGRGKPVSLLGGGAVLFRDNKLGGLLSRSINPPDDSVVGEKLLRIKLQLYNRLVSPHVYWMLEAMPFLHLGETRYHPLTEIYPMDRDRLELLGSNIAAYGQRRLEAQQAITDMVREMVADGFRLVDLPKVCDLSPDECLLRYPVLVDAKMRDSLHTRMQRLGLGSSIMYPVPLPQIEGLDKIIGGRGEYPVAIDFSERILTLPTHMGVRKKDLMAIRQALFSSYTVNR